jgi:PAS domain S-box-containing protein
MVYRCRDDAEWTMEFVSEGCARLTGYAPEDLLLNGRLSYEELTHPEDRRRVRDTINTAVAANRRFQVEYRIQHADGQVRWVWEHGGGVRDSTGRVVAIEGIVEDITERVAAEHALREAERRYRSLFDNAIEGIFRTTPDGRYLDANPALARIYGFATTQELVDSLRDIKTQLYVDSGRREEFMRIVKTRGEIGGFESRVYRKNGDTIWISENARAVFDEAGRVRSSREVPMRIALSGLPRSCETTASTSSRARTARCASAYRRAFSSASAARWPSSLASGTSCSS